MCVGIIIIIIIIMYVCVCEYQGGRKGERERMHCQTYQHGGSKVKLVKELSDKDV